MPLRYRKVTVGVCAMDKKAKSKAMLEILNRLEDFPEFEIITFGDDCILNQPIEQWPKVDALISFFSDRFPLAKVQAYAQLRKPFVVNDLDKQWDLLDRRKVYRTLAENDIPVPNHIVINRNEEVKPGVMPDWSRDFEAPGFEEHEDYVELDGKRIDKPFVEKPADAENHNICIYYPHTVGGGYKALFRKVGNQASRYYPPPAPDSSKPYTPVRRDTSFIYEDFMSTGGTDVKVYTVGPNYAHAEARKSPVVDGRVQRDENGKEERFPVLLTPDEKEIARRVCLAFGQTVCGFDLLRTKGRSYVCDVNGWSFVKNSTKYFDDASVCLRAIILQAVAPEHKATMEATEAADQTTTEDDPNAEAMQQQPDESPAEQKKKGKKGQPEPPKEELRAVLAVIRHGDRTPKQKMKMRVKHEPLLQLLKKCTGDRPRKQAKLKTPARLQELLNISRVLDSPPLAQPRSSCGSKEEWEEEVEQWKQVVSILQEGGHFSGINRKAQLKPLAWEEIPEDQRKPTKDGKEGPTERVTQALLILKFGGVLTHLGKNQAEFLGRDFRMRMYPGGDPNSDGLLRLHSTYRHDLKIYSSDEGRVQITAAAFIKGLLDLETENNQLTPILASLVNKDAKLLDFVTHEVEEDILHAKQKLYNIMTDGHVKGKNKNKEYSTSDTATYDDFELSRRPPGVPEEPLKLLRLMIDLIQGLTRQLREKCFRTNVPTHMGSPTTTTWVDTLAATAPRGSMPKGGLAELKDGSVPAGGESFLLMHARWKKLEQDIYHPRKGRYDISKVPDVYDAAKYDAIHNSHLLLDGLEELYRISKRLAEGVVPNEYGTHAHSKLRIGGTIAHSLLVKLLQDMFTTRQESFNIGKPESYNNSGGKTTDGETTDAEKGESSLRRDPSGDPSNGDTLDNEEEEEDEDEKAIKEEEETELSTTRLNHRYANTVGVHSPHRHVRTRLYFTSESHIHSLLNVLKYCNLEAFTKTNPPSLVSHRLETLGGIGDLDYLTHIVFRMYECFDVPAEDPNRFRIEILLSTGIGLDPFKQN
ncbi:predicted protein, partial [Micromonas commoda]